MTCGLITFTSSLLIVLLGFRSAAAAAWSCSIHFEGDPSQVLVFSAASVNCQGDASLAASDTKVDVVCSLQSLAACVVLHRYERLLFIALCLLRVELLNKSSGTASSTGILT